MAEHVRTKNTSQNQERFMSLMQSIQQKEQFPVQFKNLHKIEIALNSIDSHSTE